MTDSRLAIVVLAAGQGTRMRSATPKVLHELAGLPLIGHVLHTAQALDAAHLLVVVRHERDRVAAAATELAPTAVIVDQDEIPGTGRAVEQAVAAIPAGFDGDLLVLSGDVPLLDADTLARLLEAHRASAAAGTLLSTTVPDPTGYGRVVRDAEGALQRIVEHQDASEAERAIDEINSGVYVFGVNALRDQLASLTVANAQGEKYLTDVIGALREAGMDVSAVPTPDSWKLEGVNDRAQLSAAAARLNALIVRGWQLAGVTIQDPETTWIDLQVRLEPDVTILPGTQLKGATVVAEGATVGPDSTLTDTEVGRGATVTRTDATLAVIGDGASVGPFAYLRPGAELGPDGKIGTFVEVKNGRIGAGAKVPHLSYIGDAEIGAGANIGAGGITANYDGVDKHRTVIGAAVKTGAHNVFVAPVRIGDGAYTGAGTTIRKDVPAGALAIDVAPQRNLDGWVHTHRPGSAADLAAQQAIGSEHAQD
ncbi:bifunctional UDP-N-acetylglucosamine diphosphorylase/glucosamine-1-phosphate N-acetyltransferase GlmU [Gryllotalpicola ginsengisoli]|uniref:bifunctional UDP-N-acetylglucosamine diphosphorylase/glucosamine-1-phosphate N-acetyltransferase GlmU n=1 Tax=Gryllotalpicola ginsengisoli TaxID=444608 RepID=UPI0003B52037|nr:bifunctional UDP-N-acetylglucosamine diphosphorylase/glucosamine-1-phosphate N-acetyltransferase GlmU [Gryllotalpicola ginsengisoli]